jgi:hypothetical protein
MAARLLTRNETNNHHQAGLATHRSPRTPTQNMKNLTYILAMTALAAAVLELPRDSTAVAQSSANRPSRTAYVLKRIPFSTVHHELTARPRKRLWESTDENWSGYAVPLETSGLADTFSQVQGAWTIPAVTGKSRSATYSSMWVGLDGYDDATVEQIGSEQDWTGRAQQNYVWFEMYPSGSYEIEGFPADVGDLITADVQYVGQSTVQEGRGKSVKESVFQLTIRNTAKNVTYSVPTSYSTVASAARASAEWVAEAPTSGEILPLADFGTVIFSDCTATSTHSGGTPAAISFWPYDPMTMIDPNGGEAVPSSLVAGTAFSVTWAQ